MCYNVFYSSLIGIVFRIYGALQIKIIIIIINILGMRRTLMFMLSGCPEEMTIDVVNYVPVAIKPALVQMTSINITESAWVSLVKVITIIVTLGHDI